MSDEPTTEDNGPKELREARDRAVERGDAAVNELRTFKASTHFEKAGLGEKQASLFLKTNPEAEITAETVGAFIDEYGFVTEPATEIASAKEVAPADEGLGALSGAAGAATAGSAPPAQPKMSKTDFAQLMIDNPQKAAEAYARGQVERNPANVQARQLVEKGIIDH
jgi:hypothetical protein